MHAHGEDLRDVSGSAALAEAALTGWRSAPLDEQERALCAYAEALTLRPSAVGREDVDALRAAGLSDEAISDAAQVIAYFNYVNRIADGLGCDLEPGMPPPAPKPR